MFGVEPLDDAGPVSMKIAVMGAVAVGCYHGFKLARTGHDLVLIGRRQLVEAIQRQGLRLETHPSTKAFARRQAPSSRPSQNLKLNHE
jgi:2-dehydropantoate 2-reductase